MCPKRFVYIFIYTYLFFCAVANYNLSRVHIRFRIRKNYLYCRVTVNSIRCNADFSINERVDPQQWDSVRQLVKGNKPEAQVQNARLEQIRAQIKALALDLSYKDIRVTANLLKALYQGKRQLHYTLLEVSRKHIAYLEALPPDEVAPATISSYRYRHANLEDFLRTKKLTQVACEDFSPVLARDYLNYLKVERGKPMNANTASKNMQLLKKVIRFSINQQWSKFDPLQAFVVKKPKHILAPYLTVEELRVLEARSFPIERLQKIKDAFVFACHTGLSYRDVRHFRSSVHLTQEGKIKWIDMSRIKTGVEFSVPLTNVAYQILQRYGGELLPVPSNVKFNAYLKEVQDLCGISTTLTVKVARTTFGVVMLNDMNLDLEVVSKLLGHASSKITEKHYTTVLKKKIIRNLVEANPTLYDKL
jgi:site-specific recombinase XerD